METARTRLSVLDNLIKTSVTLNGLLIPAACLESTLARYVDNLVVRNDDPVFKVSLFGSAIPINYKGKYFLVCTNHQVCAVQPEDVSLLGRNGERIVTSAGVRYPTNDADDMYVDLAAFVFTEPCEAHDEFKERFYSFRDLPPNTSSDNTLFFVVAGFPSQDQQYELEERNHIGKYKRIIVCELDAPLRDPALLCLRTKEPLGFNPDGMSGGSAFVVQLVGGEPHAFFAGMVVTAGANHFRIVKAGVIEAFLKFCLTFEQAPAGSALDEHG